MAPRPHPITLVLYFLLLIPIFLSFFIIKPFYATLALIGWGLGLVHRFSKDYQKRYRFLHVQVLNQNLKAMGQAVSDLQPFQIIFILLLLFPVLFILGNLIF